MKRIVMFSLMMIGAVLLAGCGAKGVAPDANGTIEIFQEDSEEGMSFSPGDIVLTAGQKVRIVLENHGSKDHEFMIGRDVIYNDSGAPDGFETDFFHGIEDLVEVQVGDGAMLMIDGETVQMGGMGMGSDMGDESGSGDDMGSGGDMGSDSGDMSAAEEQPADEHMGWMVMNDAGSGQTIIEFTVPADLVGEWEMGCFEDDGAHYDDGMHGKLIVVEP